MAVRYHGGMQHASIPLTVILCGAAVLMVSGTLARLQVAPPSPDELVAETLLADDEGEDGEAEGDGASLAGDVLFAAPALDDPYFGGTAIYLVAHDESGALGVVLNRPRDLGGNEAPIFEGGPVGRDRVVVLHDDAARGVEVEPGIYAAADPSIIEAVIHGDTLGKVFVGYAGWGPGQLERELSEGAWLVSDATAVTVLGVRPTWSSVVY